MRKILVLFLAIAMTFSVAAFEASIEPVEREASPGEQATYEVEVFNNASEDKRFTLDYSFHEAGWIYFDTSGVVPAGETETFNVTLIPGEDAIQQNYGFTIYVTDFETGESKQLSETMRVTRDHTLNVQSVDIQSGSVMPGESVQASVTVQNILPTIVDEYTVTSSFNDETRDADTEPLAPGAVREYDFTYDIPVEASPETYNLSLTVIQDEVEKVYHDTVQVEEVREINRSQEVDDRVLIVSGTKTVENNGNSPAEITENVTLPSYLDPILDFEPEPDQVTENEENTYIWEASLRPGEDIQFSYSINYWIPLLLAVIIIAGLSALSRISGNMKINKEVEEEKEGLKVSLEIINDTEKFRPQITVRDFVPNVAELDEDFEMAAPETRKTTDGTKIEWTLEDFKPGEKRIVQYRVKPKIEVEDGIDLPPAEIIIKGDKVAKSDNKKH